MALPPARAVTPYEFFTTIRLATVAEAVSGAGISFPTARRAAAGKPLRKAAADKLARWSRTLLAAKKCRVYIGAAECVFPIPRRGRPRTGGVSPQAFFALGLRGTDFGDVVRDSGLSHNLAAKARRGESIGADAADKLEQWSRKLSSGKRAGAFIDRVLAVWPPKVN
jgi:hypothetical protein